MKMIRNATFYMALSAATIAGLAQQKPANPPERTASAAARYFQLTINLKFGANGDQQATEQIITTEVALRGTNPGSCKARMISTFPSGGTKYIELGTKFDANDIRLEGNGVAMNFVLSSSRPVKMIKYKRDDGVEVEEPIITEQTVELSIKLPLGRPKVVFGGSSSQSLSPLRSPGDASKDGPTIDAAAALPQPDRPMVIEMIVSELS